MDKKLKVLLVEDEEAILKPYSDYLASKGFEVKTASDGKEALDLVEEFDFDVMLLDIMLPKIDGLDVLKQVKANPKTKDKKVLLLTALGRDSVIKQGFDLGADGYLIKDQENPETVEQNILKLFKD